MSRFKRQVHVDWAYAQGQDMVCNRCGARRKFLPNSPEGLIAISGEFIREHSKCVIPEAPRQPETWDSPLDWVVGEDTGISSMAIWAVMMGANPARHDPPQDPGDFGACWRLLGSFPDWKARMPEVAVRFPEWAPLVAEWDILMALYEEEVFVDKAGRAPKLYERLRKLTAPSARK